MNYTSRVDGSIIELPIDKDIHNAIMISGGLDSAVLLAMLASNGIMPTTFTVDKVDGSYNNTIKLIDWMNGRWGWTIPHPQKVGNPKLHHSQQTRSAVIQVLVHNMCDRLYNGINQNPPELQHLPGAPDRTINNIPDKLVIPFFKLQKIHIIDLMFQLGFEELSEHTHSCTEQTEGRCGKCWQCTERQFAFSKLGLTDTGTY
jgi:hypothetical protein